MMQRCRFLSSWESNPISLIHTECSKTPQEVFHYRGILIEELCLPVTWEGSPHFRILTVVFMLFYCC